LELQGQRFNEVFVPEFNYELGRVDVEEVKQEALVVEEDEREKIVTIYDLYKAACKIYGLEEDQFKTKGRKREYVYARDVVYYLAYTHLRMTLAAIGRFMGGRDHSTIIHGKSIVMDAIDEPKRNPQLHSMYLQFYKRCSFEGVSYRITHKYNNGRWEKFDYVDFHNVLVDEIYKTENGLNCIIEGEIHEHGIVIKKGIFKGRMVK
jgi:hypothetical protein